MKLEGRKVLVTGADGFIGSHLVERLVEHGCRVRAFVYYNAFGTRGWLDEVDRAIGDSLDVFAGDVRDPNGVRKAVEGMDVVFHLAALIGIPFSYHSPDSYVDTNVKGTLNILQAARDHGCERVVVTSTSEVYGTARYVPIDESHPLQGQSPYSATKIAADKLAESFHKSFGLPVVTVRPFNTYGPRQSARAIIPTIIAQLLQGQKAIRLGNMRSTRDFTYVADTADGFLKVAESDSAVGEVVNLCNEREISMGELAAKLIGLIDPAARIELDEQRLRPEKSEVDRLLGCNRKAKSLASWSPRHDLSQGLASTIDWFRVPQHLERYPVGRYVV